ncbi:MAG: hypothetical protein QG657_2166 [Acidobacteriota bacterium]|nr:hypothetical protein [Acidobacteriota bacterium]
MNIHQKKLSVKELVGCNNEGITWGRLAAFFAAYFLSLLFNMLFNMLTQDYQLPPGFWLPYISFTLLGAILFTACIAVVFRFVRHIYAAILISTLGYGIINTIFHIFLTPQYQRSVVQSVFVGWLWTFLLLMALHISVQNIKQTWWALIIAYFSAGAVHQIAMLIMSRILEPASIISLKAELSDLVMLALDAAVFGGLFWAGLQLRWSRWQMAGAAGAEAGTPLPWAESRGSFELVELKKAVDTRLIKKMLRPAAIGSIVFGIIAVVTGSSFAHGNPINVILAFIGIILILEGAWCAVAPQPMGLVVDGIVLIILGVWNGLVTFANIAAGAGSSGGFIVLGIWQIVLGIKSFKNYKTYAYLSNAPVPEESLQRLDLMADNINQLSENVDESIIEFQAKTLFKKTPLKGKFIEGMILFVNPGRDSYMDKIENVKLKPHKINPDQYPAQATLTVCGTVFMGEISQRGLERFNRWQSQSVS